MGDIPALPLQPHWLQLYVVKVLVAGFPFGDFFSNSDQIRLMTYTSSNQQS
jgi:hypothetical protein